MGRGEVVPRPSGSPRVITRPNDPWRLLSAAPRVDPEMPISDLEMAVGVVCRRTGWWGSPEGAKRASGLARVVARASRWAALLVASRHAHEVSSWNAGGCTCV